MSEEQEKQALADISRRDVLRSVGACRGGVELPSELKGRVLRPNFCAVDYFTEVWVNGKRLGSHEGGHTPFEMDVTRQAKLGAENQLVVWVVDPPCPLNQRLLGLLG